MVPRLSLSFSLCVSSFLRSDIIIVTVKVITRAWECVKNSCSRRRRRRRGIRTFFSVRIKSGGGGNVLSDWVKTIRVSYSCGCCCCTCDSTLYHWSTTAVTTVFSTLLSYRIIQNSEIFPPPPPPLFFHFPFNFPRSIASPPPPPLPTGVGGTKRRTTFLNWRMCVSWSQIDPTIPLPPFPSPDSLSLSLPPFNGHIRQQALNE